MRERGHKRLLAVGVGGLAAAGVAIAASLLALDPTPSISTAALARSIGAMVVAPAQARDRRRGNDWNRRFRHMHMRALQRQGNEEAQRRVDEVRQQAEEIQRRVQQQVEQVQRLQARLPSNAQPAAPKPVLRAIGASQANVQVHQQRTQEIIKRAQEMRAYHRQRHEDAGKRPAFAARHKPAFQDLLARIRQRHASGNAPAWRAGVPGNRHSALLAAAKARSRLAHGFRNAEQRLTGYYSRQVAIYSRLLEKVIKYRHQLELSASPAKMNAAGLGNMPTASTNNSRLPNAASVAAAASGRTGGGGMSRLGGPKQPQNDDDDDDADGQSEGRPKANRGGDPRSRKPRRRNLGNPLSRLELLAPPNTFVRNEVLAISTTVGGGLAVAGADVKVLEEVNFSALGLTVSRLQVAERYNSITAIGMLANAFPAAKFKLNRVYVPYRTTGATSPSGAGTNAPPPPPGRQALATPGKQPLGGVAPRGPNPGTGCAADRCFASTLIRWQPQLGVCARDMRIGVIDTGYDKSHPAFVGARIVEPRHEILPAGSKKAPTAHGTGVLALLAGNQASATPGLVPNAQFYVENAFFDDGSGNAMSSTMTMLKALEWMKHNKVDVLNLSFAGPEDPLVHDAIIKLAKSGTVVLAAAGNDGPDADPNFPAAYPEVIGVTAVDRNLAPYAYANHGEYIALAAPGVDVWTAMPGGRQGTQTGTSFAVPFVTSVVALSYPPSGLRAAGHPLAPRERALKALQKSIKPLGGNRLAYGAGLVQAPTHCEPRSPGAVAGTWAGTVVAAPAAGVQPSGNSWAGSTTVHSVANKK